MYYKPPKGDKYGQKSFWRPGNNVWQGTQNARLIVPKSRIFAKKTIS
jgi:hypothetical protein